MVNLLAESRRDQAERVQNEPSPARSEAKQTGGGPENFSGSRDALPFLARSSGLPFPQDKHGLPRLDQVLAGPDRDQTSMSGS